MDSFLFGISSSGSKKFFSPKPSQFLHAPKGLLKEKIRGSISSIVNPDTGQAKLAENISLLFSSTSKT